MDGETGGTAARRTLGVAGTCALLLFVSLALSLALLACMQIFPDFAFGEAAMVAALLDPAVAAVGLCLVIVQLRQDNQGEERGRVIEQQRFLLEYNKVFIENDKMAQVEADLERYDAGILRDDELITDENRQSFVNYLVYLEGFAPLVLDGIMEFEMLDNLMAYRFYLAVNNPVVQRDQLFKWPGYYLGCFRLYRKWTDYRHARGLEVLREETSALDSWEDYGKWLQIAEGASEGHG